MKGFEITWIKNPLEDILGIMIPDFSCGTYCEKKTPDSCVFFCVGFIKEDN